MSRLAVIAAIALLAGATTASADHYPGHHGSIALQANVGPCELGPLVDAAFDEDREQRRCCLPRHRGRLGDEPIAIAACRGMEVCVEPLLFELAARVTLKEVA